LRDGGGAGGRRRRRRRKQNKTRGVSQCSLAIYIKKYLKAKEECFGNSNISPCKNIIFKKSSKKNKNP